MYIKLLLNTGGPLCF